MTQYNKLVRDKIPEIIEASGSRPIVRKLGPQEYIAELIKKLREESDEVAADPVLEELADVQEVLDALTVTLGHSLEEREAVRAQKAAERGGFEERIFLEGTE